jgi:calcium-translocating P-type ATPase
MSNAWHALKSEEVLQEIGSREEGLSESEIQERRERFGSNRLPEVKRRGLIIRFFSQFNNVLIYVLLGAAVITALLGHLIDTGVILAVVIVNAIIGFLQEGKAEKAMEAIRKILSPSAAVVRGGHRQTVPGEDLVPGDIVLLEAGDKVPADLRILGAYGLSVKEAVLTGESVPVEKQDSPVAEDSSLGDRTCVAFSGTIVASGAGKGVVVSIGGDTEIGRISGMLGKVEKMMTPLLQKMSDFARRLTFFILLFSVAVLLFGIFVRDMPFDEIFLAVVSLAVAAIPEGLPAVMTVTLAIGVQTMAKRKAIVRRLPAIETLGSVSVICTDKTGTLTLNEMMVASVVTETGEFNVSGHGYQPEGEITPSGDLEEVALAALLCNDAELYEEEDTWKVQGDPMEGALLAFSAKAGLDTKDRWKRLDVIPFDSQHRYMASLNESTEGEKRIFVKGAPERLLEMCGAGEEWHKRAEEMAAQGQRVLALAVKDTDSSSLKSEDVEGGLKLLGFAGLIDPPRKEAVQAVADCRSAGIRVIMITGDHKGTASAIAAQVGIEHPDRVLTGHDLDRMNDEELEKAAAETNVFARTSPGDKLRLVIALQAQGAILAMTGDGVNDAPALKRADAGVSMGLKGSEAAKEAAEIVLADDNFATLAEAVRQGRTVYDNLIKVIAWTLPTSCGEAAVIIVAILLGWMLPISPVQILWVNMVTTVTLGIALAFEPVGPGTMKRPPRPSGQPLITRVLLWRIFFVSAIYAIGIIAIFFYSLQSDGNNLAMARTMAVNAIVVMEAFYLLSIRYAQDMPFTLRGIIGTRAVAFAITGVAVFQIIFTYTPFMNHFFGSEPLALDQGLAVLALGLAVMLVLEAEKFIIRKIVKTV